MIDFYIFLFFIKQFISYKKILTIVKMKIIMINNNYENGWAIVICLLMKHRIFLHRIII